MTHLHLFPPGKYGYKVQRDIPLSTSKYLNQQLLNYSQVFAADSDYIFFGTFSNSNNSVEQSD